MNNLEQLLPNLNQNLNFSYKGEEWRDVKGAPDIFLWYIKNKAPFHVRIRYAGITREELRKKVKGTI
jgi:hypothetical protein